MKRKPNFSVIQRAMHNPIHALVHEVKRINKARAEAKRLAEEAKSKEAVTDATFINVDNVKPVDSLRKEWGTVADVVTRDEA